MLQEVEASNGCLGASRTRTFSVVFLPLGLPGILVGFLLFFILSIGVRVMTLPKRMWEGLRERSDLTMATVGALLVTISLVW